MRNNDTMGSQREGRRNQYNDDRDNDRDRQGLRSDSHDSSESYDDGRVSFSRDRDWRMNQGASISGPMGGSAFRGDDSQHEYRQGNRGQSFRDDYGMQGGYDRSYGQDSGWGSGSRGRGTSRDFGSEGSYRGSQYGGTQGSYSQNYGQQGYGQQGYGQQNYGQQGYGNRGYGEGYGSEGRNYGYESQGRGGDYYGERGFRGQGSFGGRDDEHVGSSWGNNQGLGRGYTQGSNSYGSSRGMSGMTGSSGTGSSWGAGSSGIGNAWGSGSSGSFGSSSFKKGPKGYKRSDERIKEDVCDHLASLEHVDTSDVEVQVVNGEVTLTGTVPDRNMKWEVEQRCDSVGGVKDVTNNIRVKRESETESDTNRTSRTGATAQNGENDRKVQQARS